MSPPEKDEVSIGNIGLLIANKFKYQNMIEYDTSYSDGQYKKTVSSTKVEELFPNFKFTSLEEGLNETIDWFLEKYPNVRK